MTKLWGQSISKNMKTGVFPWNNKAGFKRKRNKRRQRQHLNDCFYLLVLKFILNSINNNHHGPHRQSQGNRYPHNKHHPYTCLHHFLDHVDFEHFQELPTRDRNNFGQTCLLLHLHKSNSSFNHYLHLIIDSLGNLVCQKCKNMPKNLNYLQVAHCSWQE